MKCKRCGRILKTKESIELGYGRVCYKKMLDKKHEQQSILKYLEN